MLNAYEKRRAIKQQYQRDRIAKQSFIAEQNRALLKEAFKEAWYDLHLRTPRIHFSGGWYHSNVLSTAVREGTLRQMVEEMKWQYHTARMTQDAAAHEKELNCAAD